MMLYHEYMNKVKELALCQNIDTGMTYIVPEYEYILAHQDFGLQDVTDFPDADLQTVRRQLELERDMRNAQNSYGMSLAKWVYQFVDNTVMPATVDAENELLQTLLEYRKTTKEKNDNVVNLFENQAMMRKKKMK